MKLAGAIGLVAVPVLDHELGHLAVDQELESSSLICSLMTAWTRTVERLSRRPTVTCVSVHA